MLKQDAQTAYSASVRQWKGQAGVCPTRTLLVPLWIVRSDAGIAAPLRFGPSGRSRSPMSRVVTAAKGPAKGPPWRRAARKTSSRLSLRTRYPWASQKLRIFLVLITLTPKSRHADLDLGLLPEAPAHQRRRAGEHAVHVRLAPPQPAGAGSRARGSGLRSFAT